MAKNLFTSTSTSTSLESLAKNSVGGDSVYPLPIIKMSDDCDTQQDKEIGDLAKTFSVCAKSFGHPTEICAEDESAKDCL